MLRLLLLTALLPAVVYALAAQARDDGEPPFHRSPSDVVFRPPSYVIYRTAGQIDVDGALDEADWAAVPWTSDFVDIEGADRPAPRLRTRAKMLWDDEALYVAAELEEPHVWATLTERDAAVFRDNAFEVFIDPDGDTHNYYEYEVNALETVWDLLLVRPYRDGGPRLSSWDIRGLETTVRVNGTLNDPSDTDTGWSVEIAFPWRVLREAAPGRRLPRGGEQWRLNFARSQWPLEVVDGTYSKRVDDRTGRPIAEWSVWSPQGAVDMHRPERFGCVQFSNVRAGGGTEPFVEDPNEGVKWALRQLYYLQRDFHDARGRYAGDLAELGTAGPFVEGGGLDPQLRLTQSGYEITAAGPGGTTVHIRSDGRVWTTVQ